jgi:hypothetical protein
VARTGQVPVTLYNTLKTQALIDASKEVGLEVNAKRTWYMLVSRHQNIGQNRDIKIANRYFEMWNSSDIWERV